MVAGTLLVFFLAGGGLESCNGLPLSDGSNLPFDQAACESGDPVALAEWENYADERFIHADYDSFSIHNVSIIQRYELPVARRKYIFIRCIFKQSNKYRLYSIALSATFLCPVS